MNTRLQATLEAAIQKWCDEECESSEWGLTWMYDQQVVDMAKAAALVFDASCAGQQFAKEQDD